jgi:hypothetical protein
MLQVVSVLAALLILFAYAGNQMGWLVATEPLYGAVNLVGAAVLAGVAWRERQWGFVLLEGTWAVLSLLPLLRLTLQG